LKIEPIASPIASKISSIRRTGASLVGAVAANVRVDRRAV
jgi:hypothetical protein